MSPVPPNNPSPNPLNEVNQLAQKAQISEHVKLTPALLECVAQIENIRGLSEDAIKQLIGKAVNNAIMEILPPVVERSVTIALITTRALVLRDLAFDSSEEKVTSAADFTVQSLAGSLALVTCREPLRMSLTNNLKKLANVPDAVDEFASIASKDNLDLGCSLIKKAVI